MEKIASRLSQLQQAWDIALSTGDRTRCADLSARINETIAEFCVSLKRDLSEQSWMKLENKHKRSNSSSIIYQRPEINFSINGFKDEEVLTPAFMTATVANLTIDVDDITIEPEVNAWFQGVIAFDEDAGYHRDSAGMSAYFARHATAENIPHMMAFGRLRLHLPTLAASILMAHPELWDDELLKPYRVAKVNNAGVQFFSLNINNFYSIGTTVPTTWTWR